MQSLRIECALTDQPAVTSSIDEQVPGSRMWTPHCEVQIAVCGLNYSLADRWSFWLYRFIEFNDLNRNRNLIHWLDFPVELFTLPPADREWFIFALIDHQKELTASFKQGHTAAPFSDWHWLNKIFEYINTTPSPLASIMNCSRSKESTEPTCRQPAHRCAWFSACLDANSQASGDWWSYVVNFSLCESSNWFANKLANRSCFCRSQPFEKKTLFFGLKTLEFPKFSIKTPVSPNTFRFVYNSLANRAFFADVNSI